MILTCMTCGVVFDGLLDPEQSEHDANCRACSDALVPEDVRWMRPWPAPTPFEAVDWDAWFRPLPGEEDAALAALTDDRPRDDGAEPRTEAAA